MRRNRHDWHMTPFYAYTLGLDGPGCAWEWLRRNPDYVEDYRRERCSQKRRTAAAKLGRRPRDCAERWGLLIMEDPCLRAPEALALWRADAVSGVLRAGTRPTPGPSHRAFNFWTEPGRKAIAIGSTGAQLIIETRANTHRLLFEEPDDLTAEIPLELHLDAFEDSENQLETMRRFLLERRRPRRRKLSAHPHALKTMQMLQAIDGRAEGASYREIAEVIFGAAAANDDWHDRGLLKARTRYLIRRSNHFVHGGYRQLLIPLERKSNVYSRKDFEERIQC